MALDLADGSSLIIGTNAGVLAHDGEVVTTVLADRDVEALVVGDGVLLAGTVDGVVRSTDGGSTWEVTTDGLGSPHIRWLAVSTGVFFAGAEPASIFVSHDGGRSWRECAEVSALRDRMRWYLPYSPLAGCVRSFAFHGDRAYAGVEVGGVLRSDDRGETWRLAEGSTGEPVFAIPAPPFVHADVHWVAGHPSSADFVIAATAEGMYRSEDGGERWFPFHAGSYCRALWVDPADPNHILLGVADSVQQMDGRIEETRDGGESWTRVSDGLDLPWPHTTIERFLDVDGRIFAISSAGALFVAQPFETSWSQVDVGPVEVRAVVRIARA